MVKDATPKERGLVPAAIDRLFLTHDVITSSDVAREAGVTRQSAHAHLAHLSNVGELIHEGARRSSRYRRRSARAQTYALEGLREDEVWGAEKAALRAIDPEGFDNANVVRIMNFAFTEMVNNAIDHSRGSQVRVRWYLDAQRVSFEVEDDGVGAFTTIREQHALANDLEALAELSKGKQTTDPDRHSGLGIFFTSRMVDRFTLSASQLLWTVDQGRNDVAYGWLSEARVGTLVRVEVRRDTTVTPNQVFAARSNPTTSRLDTTTIHVGLFRTRGGDFISRTEAKRVGSSLEGFDVVELDFTDVHEIGQGFADELFRVWARDNPSTRLVPINANPAILAMIARVDVPRSP
ncbi:MAG: ATP-binding protein [Acidobacteriota bacterium]|nr:ATP-binding protein [Acidobacteriota bacterium]